MTAGAPVLTLDGPSGSGKGTAGQLLARRLGWHFLDSGALYRGLAWAAERAGVDPGDAQGVLRLAGEIEVRFEGLPGDGPVRVVVNGADAGERLRTEEIGRCASRLAVDEGVRAALLRKQRAFRLPPGLVADGRDMGTTVFPEAVIKVYLTASPDVRAGRRYKQLKEKGFNVSLSALLEDIRERDARDAQRRTSPLRPAVDAWILDTSSLSVFEVVERIFERVRERRMAAGYGDDPGRDGA